jgi:hypothetical protein
MDGGLQMAESGAMFNTVRDVPSIAASDGQRGFKSWQSTD